MVVLNDTYTIRGDSSNFILTEKCIAVNQKTNEEYEDYKILGYYPTIEGCINGLIKYKTRKFVSKEDINTMKELLDAIEQIKKEVKEMIKE